MSVEAPAASALLATSHENQNTEQPDKVHCRVEPNELNRDTICGDEDGVLQERKQSFRMQKRNTQLQRDLQEVVRGSK